MLGLAYVLTIVFNDSFFFLFVPALFSAALLLGFGRSLLVPPSLVEKFARAIRSDLSDEHVAYCRRVTMVWTAFFLLNGSLSVLLALAGSLEAWTLYNGLIAYILMGMLFAGEFLYRRHRFPQLRKAMTGPERLHRSSGDGWLELRLRVPENLCYFEGHFDGFPVVAGVVQLEWVHELAGELLGAPPAIARMEQIKFHQLLQPGQTFSARLDHDQERSRVTYVLHDGETRFASGRMVLK
jgi:3-hydroxymyristoyl/3-hydroxydecanoyl-(acyl carrier protein) dehydratase